MRAPASSFDSLTLCVVSSPIKKLAKAKFWVKIMDANKMEFESKELTFNDFDNISSLLRYLVLEDGHTNDQNLIIEEKQPYLTQILSHFSKPEKTISFYLPLNKNDIFSTYEFKEENYSFIKDKTAYNLEVQKVFELLPEEASTTVTIHPVLNGVLYQFNSIHSLREIDSSMGYLNEYSKRYYHKRKLGTYLSYDYLYFIDNIKKDKIPYIEHAIKNQLDFNIGGHTQKIKSMKEFNKIITDLTKAES